MVLYTVAEEEIRKNSQRCGFGSESGIARARLGIGTTRVRLKHWLRDTDHPLFEIVHLGIYVMKCAGNRLVLTGLTGSIRP